jgi:hypothetical protein
MKPMRRQQWVSGLVAAGLIAVGVAGIAGCGHHREPAGPAVAAPADAATVADIRRAYKQADPDALVGLVIATLPDSQLAAVGDVPVSEFKAGDVVTFIDSNQATIAVGTVEVVKDDVIHVKYEPRGDAARAPREGDLAVRVRS